MVWNSTPLRAHLSAPTALTLAATGWLFLTMLAPVGSAWAQASPADAPSSAPVVAATPAPPAAPASAVPADLGLAALVFRADQTLKFDALEPGSVSPAQLVTLAAGPAASAPESYAVSATGDFKVAPAKCELAARGACALSISFAPTKRGATKGAIVVSAAQGGPTRVVAELTGTGVGLCEARGFGCSGWTSAWPTVALSLAFFVSMMFVRWNMVAWPAREQLKAEIAAVRSRMLSRANTVDDRPYPDVRVMELLAEAEQRVNLGKRWEWLYNVFFWTRGQENMGFHLLHEAKTRLVSTSPPEVLRVELEVAEHRLRVENKPAALALADTIKTELNRHLLDLNDRAAAALRETKAYLRASATDLASAVTTSLATSPATSVDAMSAIARQLETALAKDRQTALTLTLCEAMKEGTSAAPPEYRALLGHAAGLMALAGSTRDQLETVRKNTGATDADWRRCLVAYQQGYLAEAEDLRKRIEQALDASSVAPPERWRALASEANSLLYAVKDTEFAWTASWHKKTLWLVMMGLSLMCALAATLEHAVFLLLGALGGLLSRMQRMLGREKVAVDYGQSWVTLFLSPVVGALAGWTGMLLTALAVKLGVLGALFQDLNWDQSYHVLSLAMATLFGISERLLVTVVETMGAKTGGKPEEKDEAAKTEAAAPDNKPHAKAGAASQATAATASEKSGDSQQGTKAPP